MLFFFFFLKFRETEEKNEKKILFVIKLRNSYNFNGEEELVDSEI